MGMIPYIPLKLQSEILRIKSVCRILSKILGAIPGILADGITTQSISDFCSQRMIAAGVEPAVEGFNGFPGKICVSVNSAAAHGIPGPTTLHEGDILTVDISGKANGWYGDTAWTFLIGQGDPAARRLLKAAWQSTMAGISEARCGNRLGDIGHAIEATAARYGCSIVKNCVGHGIGTQLHEEPPILPYGEKATGLPIKPGMVFTVEPVLTLGTGIVGTINNEHELFAKDNALCAQFEHTVAVFSTHTEILSSHIKESLLDLDFPPYF